MFDNLAEVKERFEAVTRQLSDPAVISDQANYRKLSREHNELAPIISAFDQFRKTEQELADTRQMIEDPDEDQELKAMASQEIPVLEEKLESLADQLRVLLVPKDPLDSADIVLEIRAGTGGEEATLFAGDLYRMYLRFAERHGWKIEILNMSHSGVGGFKEIIVGVQGEDVYKNLKFESGVHRVQRIPQTESQGRIHTSAATVAVLPAAEEVEVDIQESDLRVEKFRSSGPGGQSVNTTDSAVRITHIPTGIVAQSQDEKSQHKNKAKAMKVLRARLYEKLREEQRSEEAEKRRGMVGSGDRSERIRTYNFPEGRVTDHRINLKLYKLDEFLTGEMDEIVEGLLEADQAERLKHSQSG
ncbi:MAG: peptide chain release factor 1 [SAR324 cluster bacterium]|nr:peptide chain release factor 1 [SAR324 cluster bacterium]